MKALETRIPPPVMAVALGIAMWAVSRVTAPAAGGGVVTTALAIVLALAGGACDLAGAIAFRRARTTANPLKPEKASSLVTGGIYRFTRNPMYVGVVLVLVAWAMYLVNVWSLFGPIAFVAYVTRFQIKPEERMLLSRFGQEYAAYMARVRRWL